MPAPNPFAALASHDLLNWPFLGALRVLAGALMKMANDLLPPGFASGP